jgi:hypothetical protein
MSISMTITNDGYDLWRNASKGTDNPLITYFALGSSSVSPTVNDHTLGAETFRKAVTSYTNGSSHGELLVSVYVAPADAVGLNIQEICIIGGNSATISANTGILIARGLYIHNPKLNTESLQLQLDLVF